MTDPLETILQQTAIKNSYFTPTSRYFGLETDILNTPNNTNIAFVKRRFIGPPKSFHLIEEHAVNQAERLDNIAHQYLGDAEQFWRICDANAVMHPHELTNEIGKKIKITLPEGINGNSQ